MLSALLIVLREGLEAALIVGIVLSVLRRRDMTDKSRWVWLGVGVAVLTSIMAALVLRAMGVAFEGRQEEIFEGVAMLLAAGILTWMIFWMQGRGRETQQALERDVERAAAVQGAWGLFGLAFVAVVREGIETVLFMTAASMSSTPAQVLIGGAIGLLIAIALGWALFRAGTKFSLQSFFQVTGVLLILFAAGLFAHGVHEFQEAGLIPVAVEHLYDINPVLSESGVVGSFLQALFGYNGNPSLLEAVVYALYLVAIGVLSWRLLRRPAEVRSMS